MLLAERSAVNTRPAAKRKAVSVALRIPLGVERAFTRVPMHRRIQE
jgi:hypothetical protein